MEFFHTKTHQAGVLDIQFDFYGRRFATCYGDRQIHVYDVESSKDSTLSEPLVINTEHTNLIWRISWAHPEFGNLLASCSQDKTVLIYEEQENVDTKSQPRWIKKAQFSDSKSSVYDVKFAPRHWGLKLASVSADGYIRIYEATDVFTLNYWPLQDSFYVDKGLVCLSWNDSPCENPKIVVGGESKQTAIWTCDNGVWKEECKLGEQDGTIRDVSWAPCMGRSFHLIATADATKCFRIYPIKREAGKLIVQPPFILESSSPVWRLAWNATGTVLATSSEKGKMDLWRRDFSGIWKLVQSIEEEGTKSLSQRVYKLL